MFVFVAGAVRCGADSWMNQSPNQLIDRHAIEITCQYTEIGLNLCLMWSFVVETRISSRALETRATNSLSGFSTLIVPHQNAKRALVIPAHNPAMVDSSAIRRSTRRKSSPVRQTYEEDSDSSESDSNSSVREAPRKRTKAKAASKRAPTKRTKTKGLVVQDVVEDQEEDTDRVENYLYAAIMDQETSIDTLVNDFLASYEEEPTESIRDLVNMVLRCCGAKMEVTTYDIEDADAIPETLTQLQDHMTGKDADVIKISHDTYPLVSRNKTFKGFRRQLSEFWTRLITYASDKQILYEDESSKLFPTIEAWLVSMSSSNLRAFRHTSTTICLTIMTCMIEMSAQCLSDLEIANKQLVSEKKKSKGAKKLQVIQDTLDAKAKQNEQLTGMITNHFDAVFLHRYRDMDAKIRSECIKELGGWMMTLPTTFFDGQYLRYLGWVLSDTHGATRMEVIRALTKLYGYDQFVGSLRHFTERFKPRMIEIALEDVEVPIRCAAISLLEKVRQRGYLEDEETNLVLGCILDAEEKVRASISGTFKGVLQDRQTEMIDEVLMGEMQDQGELKSSWIILKALTSIVSAVIASQHTTDHSKETKFDLAQSVADLSPGRVRLAARFFLVELEEVDFDEIVAYLLYDNDATKSASDASPADLLKSVLLLDTQEETILLEVMVAAAELAAQDAERTAKKNDDLPVIAESIVDVLPQLLARFADAHMLRILLQLLTVCDLSVFSKLRKTALFDSLLDTIVKIFLGYQEESLLADVGSLFIFLGNEATLSTNVKDKVVELQETLRNALSQLKGAEESYIPTVRRIAIISASDDCVASFENTSNDGLSILARLKDFLASGLEPLRSYSRTCVRNYFMWKVKQLTETRFGLVVQEIEDLIMQKDDVISILDAQIQEGDAGATSTVVDLENIFVHLNTIESYDGLLTRQMFDANLQELLARLFQKAAKTYGKLHNRAVIVEDDLSSDEENEESDSEDEDLISKKIDSERKVCAIAGEIVSSLSASKIDNKFMNLLVRNKGKLGASFDMILKELGKEQLDTVIADRPKARARSVKRTRRPTPTNEDVIMSEIGGVIEE